MGLTKSQISALYAGSRRTAAQKGRRKRQFYFAGGELVKGKIPAELAGSFTGKQGSIRRSRKGASRIQPNGSRRYQHGFWADAEMATAYKV
jgi:hypothetical protein